MLRTLSACSVTNGQTSVYSDSQSARCVSAPVDSTESSEECIISADRCCLSAISGEIVDDCSLSVCQSSKPCPPLCRTPSLKINSSPAITRRKPCVAPKPPHLANAQVQIYIQYYNHMVSVVNVISHIIMCVRF